MGIMKLHLLKSFHSWEWFHSRISLNRFGAFISCIKSFICVTQKKNSDPFKWHLLLSSVAFICLCQEMSLLLSMMTNSRTCHHIFPATGTRKLFCQVTYYFSYFFCLLNFLYLGGKTHKAYRPFLNSLNFPNF